MMLLFPTINCNLTVYSIKVPIVSEIERLYICENRTRSQHMKKNYFLLLLILMTASVSTAQTSTLYQHDGVVRGAEIPSGDTIVINQNSSEYHFRFELGVTGNTGDITSKVRVLRINPNACYTYQLCGEITPDTDFQNNCWDINSSDYMSPTLVSLDPASQSIVYYPKGVPCTGSTHLRYIVYVNDVVVDSVDYIINNGTLSTPTVSKDEEVSMSIYPNPANSILNITTQGLEGYEVKMTDVLGKVVYNESVAGSSKKVDVSDFKTGVYLVTITEKGTAIQTRRIVVKH